MHNYKTILRMQILYIPNNCSTKGHWPFLVWGGIQATTSQLQPRNCLQRCIAFSLGHIWGFCSCISGVTCIVRPHSDYWCVCYRQQRVCYQPWVSRKLTIVFSMWSWKTIYCNEWCRCASRQLLDLRSVIAPVFRNVRSRSLKMCFQCVRLQH